MATKIIVRLFLTPKKHFCLPNVFQKGQKSRQILGKPQNTTSATLLLRMLISFRSRIIVHLSNSFYFLGSDCSYMSPGARAGTRMSEDIWHCAEWGWPKKNLASLLASRRMFRGNCCFQNLLFPENGIVEPQGIDPGSKPAVERLGEEQACRLGAGWNISQPQNLLCHKCLFTPRQFVLVFPKEEVDYTMLPRCHTSCQTML